MTKWTAESLQNAIDDEGYGWVVDALNRQEPDDTVCSQCGEPYAQGLSQCPSCLDDDKADAVWHLQHDGPDCAP